MSKKIDIVFVKPGGRLDLFGKLAPSLSGFAPPLDIGLLAAFMRERGYSVGIIDADAEFLAPSEVADKVIAYDPLLVGIFAHTIRMLHAGRTAAELKKKAPEIKVLFGGRHPSALPEKTLTEEHADFVCEGEAFYPLIELINVLRGGKESSNYKINGLWYRDDGRIVSNPPAPLLKNLDELPFIAWDLLPMDKYRAHNWHCFSDLDKRQPYAIIYTSIGCPFNCTYCCVNTVYGSSGIRYRSPQKVVEEIGYLVKNYKVRNLRMVDDIFTFDSKRVTELCDLIIERGYDLNIWIYGRIDTVTGPMLKKMKKAGITWLCYGLEAGHEKVREGVFKRIRTDRIHQGVAMTQEAGIYILANFVFGLPDDNFETMQETLDMAKRYNFEYINFYSAMAWPGSKLYEDAVRNGARLPRDWSGYAQLSEEATPVPTKYLTAAQVLKFRDDAFMDYFSSPRYQKMIEEKFGPRVLEHIKDMLRFKLRRRLLEEELVKK